MVTLYVFCAALMCCLFLPCMTSINALGTRSLSLKSVSEPLPATVVVVSERGREQTEVVPDFSGDDSPPPPPPEDASGVGGETNPVESCFEK